MYATLLTAVVLAQPPQPPGQPPQPGQPGAIPRAGAAAQSLDGDWQVIALEKDGRPVDGAATFTVSVRNNVVTFSGGEERNRPHAMRVEFGPNGTIRMTEQGAGDRPGAAPGERPAAGERPGGAPPGERPAAGSPTAGAKTGVYIMAGDYLAVSLHDRAAGTTPGARPGGLEPTRPGAPPAGTPPGAPPTGTQPGATPPATGTAGTGFSAALPSEKASFSVILKRSGAGRTPGAPGSPGGIPDKR